MATGFEIMDKFEEIERKFLIDISTINVNNLESLDIKQGYMFNTETGVARIRKQDGIYLVTFKNAVEGISRTEVEIFVSQAEGERLFQDFCTTIIDKTRYHYVSTDWNLWEIDVFHGDNEGLVVAEIELNSPDEEFIKPYFVLEEVSDDYRYFNNNLIQKPFKDW